MSLPTWSELAGVLDFLGPRKVGDVDEAVNALFNLDKHAEVGEVAHLGRVAAADGILLFDVLPRIVLELLDAKAHLAFLTVEGKHHGLHFVAYFQEVLCAAEVLAPAHLAHVDESFHAGLNLNECAVVGHYYYAAVDVVADFDLLAEAVPWMGLQLFETEGDALLLVVEVDDYDLDVLVEAPQLREDALTRPQLRSVMWTRPSTPPRSTNTPYAVMFLTLPSSAGPFQAWR